MASPTPAAIGPSSPSLSAVSMGVASPGLDLAAWESNLPAMRRKMRGPEREKHRCLRFARDDRHQDRRHLPPVPGNEVFQP